MMLIIKILFSLKHTRKIWKSSDQCHSIKKKNIHNNVFYSVCRRVKQSVKLPIWMSTLVSRRSVFASRRASSKLQMRSELSWERWRLSARLSWALSSILLYNMRVSSAHNSVDSLMNITKIFLSIHLSSGSSHFPTLYKQYSTVEAFISDLHSTGTWAKH